MKKLLGILMMVGVMAFALCGCGGGSEDPAAEGENAEAMSGEISVVAREDGSGTRDAFNELMGIIDENDNDLTYDGAEITNSTSVMLSTVAGNPKAIGYVSLGSLSDDVKAVKVDGVEPSVEDIKSGSYKVSRPFNIAYKDGGLSDVAQDFMNYILSAEGQKVIEDEGYISVVDGAESYTASGLSGKVTLAGSTSVSPVMDVLADEYKKLNPDVTIEIQQSGSSAGISSAIEGACDIGMSSRDLKDSEAAELVAAQIALDGIAVIVNNENTIEDLTSDQINGIFTGAILDWADIQK
ncbi:MAG: substrate-binding domain-containing protein [Bacillota bacterium]|jgi:phosphate transport system substrate-binding protein